jgi:head-tail adaptor
MRVKFTDPKNSNAARYFNIRAIANPDERNEMLALQCSEVTI